MLANGKHALANGKHVLANGKGEGESAMAELEKAARLGADSGIGKIAKQKLDELASKK